MVKLYTIVSTTRPCCITRPCLTSCQWSDPVGGLSLSENHCFPLSDVCTSDPRSVFNEIGQRRRPISTRMIKKDKIRPGELSGLEKYEKKWTTHSTARIAGQRSVRCVVSHSLMCGVQILYSVSLQYIMSSWPHCIGDHRGWCMCLPRLQPQYGFQLCVMAPRAR